MANLFDAIKAAGYPVPAMTSKPKKMPSLIRQAGLDSASAGTGAGSPGNASGAAGGVRTPSTPTPPPPAAPGTPGGANPAIGGAGNQEPNRPGAMKPPTAEETKQNKIDAAISHFQSPYQQLVDRIAAEQAKVPKSADVYAEERGKAGLPDLEKQISDTQSVIDSINQRLGLGLQQEKQRTIPMSLLRGRSAALQEQGLGERAAVETSLGRLESKKTGAEALVERMARARMTDAQQPVTNLEKQLELQKGIPGQDKALSLALAPLTKEPKAPEYKTIGKNIVKIGANGKAEVIYKGSTAVGSGTGSKEEKEVAAFRKDAAGLIDKIDSGEISFGTAFDHLKAMYPKASNETIDAILGGSANYDVKTGQFGEPTGRAKMTPDEVAKRKKKK